MVELCVKNLTVTEIKGFRVRAKLWYSADLKSELHNLERRRITNMLYFVLKVYWSFELRLSSLCL